jgi:hypothetical protein
MNLAVCKSKTTFGQALVWRGLTPAINCRVSQRAVRRYHPRLKGPQYVSLFPRHGVAANTTLLSSNAESNSYAVTIREMVRGRVYSARSFRIRYPGMERLPFSFQLLVLLGFTTYGAGAGTCIPSTRFHRSRYRLFARPVPWTLWHLGIYSHSPGVYGVARVCLFSSWRCNWNNLGRFRVTEAATRWRSRGRSASCWTGRCRYRAESSSSVWHSHVLRRKMTSSHWIRPHGGDRMKSSRTSWPPGTGP